MIVDYNSVESFKNTVDLVRSQPPEAGLAALSGKTPNKALQKAFAELCKIDVTLQKSGMSYKWRAISKVDPRLGHAIEEVLVFGDALFSAWGKRQTPEGLKQDYIDLKQRFSKIIKETQSIAAPKEEKKLFSFFDKPSSQETKTELRLDQLDVLLEEAHGKSRSLLAKTEKDLIEERAFHKAAEWYVLAIEKASKNLKQLVSKSQISADLVNDLQNSLTIATGTSSAILTATDQWLRVKESLHNKSITFLTAHENTFTIIQGHLRSWKDIQQQTEAMNSLSDAVKAGSSLMATASSGVEQPLAAWNASLITPEAIKSLSDSFADYDKDINTLMAGLVDSKKSSGPQFSRWDDWSATKRDLVDPILNAENKVKQTTEENLRPVFKVKKEEPAVSSDVKPAPVPEVEAAPEPEVLFPKKKVRPLRRTHAAPRPLSDWNRFEKIVAFKAVKDYKELLGVDFSLERGVELGWSPEKISENLSLVSREIEFDKLKNLPIDIRQEINYLTQKSDPQSVDWSALVSREVIPFDGSWNSAFSAWMKKQDDLDWSYLMEWNDLVYDLMIIDFDEEQKNHLKTPDGQAMAQSLKSRIESFLADPGLSDRTLKEWGFVGIVVRHAVNFGVDEKKINKAWKIFSNPDYPVDWTGRPVADWASDYKNDINRAAVVEFLDKRIDFGFAEKSPANPSFLNSEEIKKNRHKKEPTAETAKHERKLA